MKISIIMAVYNGEKYLIRQLRSIINQTKKIEEVILIDDCSKDKSVEIIEEFIKKNKLYNWKLIINKKNLGYKNNFKKGLSLVNGDIIFLADQDDIWHTDKVEKILTVMNNDILAISSSFNFINQNDETFTIKQSKNKSNNNIIDFKITKKLTEIDLKYLLRSNIAQGCTMAVRKELVNEYLQVTKGKLPHDWDLNLIASIHNGCYFYDEKLIDYRIHDANTIGLDEVDETFLENKDKRTKDRISYLESELENIEYVLNLDLTSQDRVMCLRNKRYLKDRIKYIKKAKIFKLVKYYISGKYHEFGRLKTFLGDIVSIVRKNDLGEKND